MPYLQSAALWADDDDADVITVGDEALGIEVEGELGLDEILRRAAAEIERVSSHPPPVMPAAGARRFAEREISEPRPAARTPPFRPPNMSLLTSTEGRSSVPRLLASADRISELAPGRRVAFVSGLIDGVADVESIFDMSGLDEDAVVVVLDTLLELGLMVLGDPPPPPRSVRPTRSTSSPFSSAPTSARSSSLRPSGPPAFDEAFRLSVDTLLSRLERSVAQLLGSRGSEDAMLREKRFHNLLATYHPDRFAGVELGAYRAKLESLCAALVAAYEGRPARAVPSAQLPIEGTSIEWSRSTTGTPIARISHRPKAIVESDASELRPRQR